MADAANIKLGLVADGVGMVYRRGSEQTTALVGCWLVLIVALVALMTTGSRAAPLVTAALLLSPL